MSSRKNVYLIYCTFPLTIQFNYCSSDKTQNLGAVEMVVVQQNGEEYRQSGSSASEEIDWDQKPLLDRSSFQTGKSGWRFLFINFLVLEFDTDAYLKVSFQISYLLIISLKLWQFKDLCKKKFNFELEEKLISKQLIGVTFLDKFKQSVL